MTDIEMKIEDEDFTEELSDEALDREGTRFCAVSAFSAALAADR